jgi:lysophospholipase L1-like esterase
MSRGIFGRLTTAAALAGLSACGGSGGMTGPGSDGDVYDVVATVFYDQNGNGMMDSDEGTRIPNATVEIAGRSGRSEKGSGRVVISGVPTGMYTLTVRSLPPFYQAGAPVAVQVPQPMGQELRLPVTLPVAGNRANTYMAFGDSITVGDGSSDGNGYRDRLQVILREDFGSGLVLDRGAEGTNSAEGAERIDRGLRALKPAFTLTLYGTNDWNTSECQASAPCFTIDSLRAIVRSVRNAGSHPFLATIIPGNPQDARVPPERNAWVHAEDDLIRGLAREEGAVLVDLEAAFLREPDLSSLFDDHVHPNDKGYTIMANEFARAISEPQAGASALSLEPAWAPRLLHAPAPSGAVWPGPTSNRSGGGIIPSGHEDGAAFEIPTSRSRGARLHLP